MKLQVIIEKSEGLLWARIEGRKDYLPVTAGKTVKEVFDNLRMLIEDHKKHEGKNDKFWKKINPKTVEFDIRYDVQAFFEEYDFLNVSAIAKRAGLNPSLVRQYVSGIKYPSANQVKKIEAAVHKLAKELQGVSFA